MESPTPQNQRRAMASAPLCVPMERPQLQSFDVEPPICPFRKCDMHSSHDVVGRGWDFEYHSTRDEIDLLQCRSCRLIFPRGIPVEAALCVIYPPHYYSFAETESPNRLVMAVRAWMTRRKGSKYRSMVSTPLADVVDAGQQEMLNWFCLMGAMSELNGKLTWSQFVETYVFNSDKVAAIYEPVLA